MSDLKLPVLNLRVCLLGAGHVGKSALTLRYMYDEFVEDYEPTKCSAYKRKIHLPNYDVEVDITDTAGQEDYAGISDSYCRSNDGFLVVFSLTDHYSVDSVRPIIERIVQCKGNNIPPIVLVGNKCDLTSERLVTMEKVMDLVKEFNIEYQETSAKTSLNVERAFVLLIDKLIPLKIAVPSKPAHVKQRGNDCCAII